MMKLDSQIYSWFDHNHMHYPCTWWDRCHFRGRTLEHWIDTLTFCTIETSQHFLQNSSKYIQFNIADPHSAYSTLRSYDRSSMIHPFHPSSIWSEHKKTPQTQCSRWVVSRINVFPLSSPSRISPQLRLPIRITMGRGPAGKSASRRTVKGPAAAEREPCRTQTRLSGWGGKHKRQFSFNSFRDPGRSCRFAAELSTVELHSLLAVLFTTWRSGMELN